MEGASDLVKLQQEAMMKNELAKTLIGNLKKEAKRMLTLLAKYQSQKSSDGILTKIPNQVYFEDIQQYCDLISKQFCSRIQEVNEKITKVKLDISKLRNEVRARPDTNTTQQVIRFQAKMDEFQLQFQQLWKEQHFLVLNYRMDIAAKQLQRWTQILNVNKLNQQKIREDIKNLFS